MTKVFVHGVPETAAIWGPLVAELAILGVDDVVTLSPPGFGSPVPADWEATPGAYVDWLASEIELLGGPVDLLGHDWGAGHVIGLAASRPDLVNSWAIDIAGLIHADYQWHDMAMAFQTPDVGEELVGAMAGMATPELAASYTDLGMDSGIALAMAAALDTDMADCILRLYRAAAQPYLRDMGDRIVDATRRPSLIVDATADPYVSSSLTPGVAARLNSSVLPLEGKGHWWMLEAPTEAAKGLSAFWR